MEEHTKQQRSLLDKLFEHPLVIAIIAAVITGVFGLRGLLCPSAARARRTPAIQSCGETQVKAARLEEQVSFLEDRVTEQEGAISAEQAKVAEKEAEALRAVEEVRSLANLKQSRIDGLERWIRDCFRSGLDVDSAFGSFLSNGC